MSAPMTPEAWWAWWCEKPDAHDWYAEIIAVESFKAGQVAGRERCAAMLESERERCAAIAAPERIPYSDEEWSVRCEIRDAIRGHEQK